MLSVTTYSYISIKNRHIRQQNRNKSVQSELINQGILDMTHKLSYEQHRITYCTVKYEMGTTHSLVCIFNCSFYSVNWALFVSDLANS